MPRRNIQPVSVAGIEFAALLNETQTYSADIPSYPVETGFSVSDNIALQPMELPLTLLISDTPLTWRGRARSVSETEAMLKELYFKKTTFTVVTPSGTFSNMGITSMQIKKSTDLGFDKEVSLSLQEVPTTETRTTAIPGPPALAPGAHLPPAALVDLAAPAVPAAAPARRRKAPAPSSTTWRHRPAWCKEVTSWITSPSLSRT